MQGIEGEVEKQNLGSLRLPEWFQMVDRKGAETQLATASPGKFIIRPTVHGKDGEFSLSVRSNGPQEVSHFKLTREPGKAVWNIWGNSFKTLQEFVTKYQKKPIEKKNKEKIHLDKDAVVDIIVAEETEYTDPYYFDEGEYEDDPYDDSTALDDIEESDDEQQNVVMCTKEYIKKEEGTMSVKAGERLIIHQPSHEGWVYVGREKGEELGYIPDDIISTINR